MEHTFSDSRRDGSLDGQSLEHHQELAVRQDIVDHRLGSTRAADH
jgi:hypothetical protein